MAEGTALEMRCAGNCTEGSNPSRSVLPLNSLIKAGNGPFGYGQVEFDGRAVPFHGSQRPAPFSKSIRVMMSAGLHTPLRLKSH